MDPNGSDFLSVRKAIAASISQESFQIRQQYRHEMAKKRREEMENQRMINRKIKEIRDKEREIALRYRQRHVNGVAAGAKKKTKTKQKFRDEDSITVLLPVIRNAKKTLKLTEEEIEYESHSIPKKMLPNGREDITAYKVVRKTNDLYRKYGEKRQNIQNGVRSGIETESRPLAENNENVSDFGNTVSDFHAKEPLYRIQRNYQDQNYNYMQRYKAAKSNFYRNNLNYNCGPSYNEILSYYRAGGGLHRDDLAIFGKSRSVHKYELLVVDDGPRTEEIRVKQSTVSNPRAYDILTITENNNRGSTPV